LIVALILLHRKSRNLRIDFATDIFKTSEEKLQKTFETRIPWSIVTYQVTDERVSKFTIQYGSTLEWCEKLGFQLITEERESGLIKGSRLILGGGAIPYEDHVTAILAALEIPEHDRSFIAAKVAEFREKVTKKSPAQLELDRLRDPAVIPEYFEEMPMKHQRQCLVEIFQFLETYPAQGELLKVRIASALGLRKNLDDAAISYIETAEKLRDQLGTISVLAETLSAISRSYWYKKDAQ